MGTTEEFLVFVVAAAVDSFGLGATNGGIIVLVAVDDGGAEIVVVEDDN